MASGRRSLSARDGRSKRPDNSTRIGPKRIGSASVAPLYKRLPHGPHRLDRDEVILHQRARIHGALVEAVARDGYERTSVKQVIGLAGVSRRSFYEQFANKQECFLATFDLIAHRHIKQIRRAYLAVDGPLDERARAAFECFARVIDDDRNASVLVVLEAQRAGSAAAMRLRNAASACEHMLARSFADSHAGMALPMPIVRGIAGGLHGVASTFLRDQHTAGSVDLADEMLCWTLPRSST